MSDDGAADAFRRVLLAERDAARRDRAVLDLRTELAELKLELQAAELETAECRHEIEQLRAQLAVLFGSLSWRLGAPVRRAASVANRLRTAVGLPAPAPLPTGLPVLPPPPAPAPVLGLRDGALLRRLQRRV